MIIQILIVVVILLVAGWMYGHRDPDVDIRKFNGYLSPADGTICEIIDVKNHSEFIKKNKDGITAHLKDFKEAKHIIVIMMKVWHIHTQRAPFDCVVKSVKHKDGKFLNAVGEAGKATRENENLAFTLEGKKKCKVYLIAGLLARRIVPLTKKGTYLKQGDKIGRIKFGSQVALVIPKSKVLVKVGDRVKVGETRIAQ